MQLITMKKHFLSILPIEKNQLWTLVKYALVLSILISTIFVMFCSDIITLRNFYLGVDVDPDQKILQLAGNLKIPI